MSAQPSTSLLTASISTGSLKRAFGEPTNRSRLSTNALASSWPALIAASSSAYLEATYNSAGNRITTLHDINNTVGANQGYIVAWNAGVIEVRNKASMTSTQSGNIIVEAFK